MSEPPSKKVKKSYNGDPFELKCVNTIRALSADMPQEANSGHPGAPMGCAPMAHLLWAEMMKYSASNPKWWNRDRFVLSNGHACALQYSMLHMAGYDLSIEDLKGFRSLGSKTPGHPENFVTAGEFLLFRDCVGKGYQHWELLVLCFCFYHVIVRKFRYMEGMCLWSRRINTFTCAAS